MAEHFQIAIIGSGPGGLGAAVNAGHHGISHVLFEKSELANTIHEYQLKKLVMAEPRRLPLRSQVVFVEGSREEVLINFDKALRENQVKVEKAEVSAIAKQEDGKFKISYNQGFITCDNVVLAIGTMGTPRKLGVPGEDFSHIVYTLADPEAFQGRDIIVVGAGDSAIENALALSEKNSVSIINRSGEFPRAKDANRVKILDAIKNSKIRCFYNAAISKIEENTAYVGTPEGEVSVKCNLIIVRAGSVPPRKFVESCGVIFPSAEITAVPVVSEKYESNVSGLYIVGSLIGYPLIKQAINQGYEVIEHILGNKVDPADQILIDEILGVLGQDTNATLQMIRKRLRLFADLSSPQFREMLCDSKLHLLKEGDVVFERNDYTDTVWSVVDGSVGVEISSDATYRLIPGNFFGEMGLISGRRRTATVRALESSVLLETKRNQVLKLMSSVPSVKSAIDKVFLLRVLKTSIFPDADPMILAELVNSSVRKNFKKSEIIFREGDSGDSMYVILKGSVKISRRNARGTDVAQTYLSAGNYFGEMALLGNSLRNATITAAVPCETLRVEKTQFLDFLEKNPETKKRVIELSELRKIENITSSRDEKSGAVLNFILAEGVSDAENVLLIDSDLCVGCDNCEKACAATHNGYSRLDRKGGKSFASIQLPISCRHCENPLCMLDCPPDALERRPNGEVIIKDSCIGCGNCTTNCPYGVIQLVYDKPKSEGLFSFFKPSNYKKGPAKAAKCDMCSSLDGGPACVRSCPTGAAMRVNPTQMIQLLSRK
jgi:CRP-like cAMP-binding protein/thioredoxin reductase/Fe-S-cluster-containing hydrogenase component 2